MTCYFCTIFSELPHLFSCIVYPQNVAIMKNKWLKMLSYVVGIIVILLLAGFTYVKVAFPNVGPAPEMKIAGTAAQLERGAYLANNVMVCMECHSQRDWSLFAAPSKPGTRGVGGEVHDQRLGFPGKYVSTNLTPHHLSSWSDGDIFRAITCGVHKDGKALFPIMPHPNFGQLDEADIKSVIAYLRTLEPVKFDTEPSSSDFPMNIIINFIPQKANLKPAPPKSNKVAYGEYLVTAASCYSCHTKQKEDGTFIGPDFAGGMEFTFEDGSTVRAANLTPHASGIGNWTAAQFVQRFKFFVDSNYVAQAVKAGDFQTVMPWNTYAGMTEEDLQAIFAYLQTIPPAENTVERFTPAR